MRKLTDVKIVKSSDIGDWQVCFYFGEDYETLWLRQEMDVKSFVSKIADLISSFSLFWLEDKKK